MQIFQLDILTGCAGFRLEADESSSQEGRVCLRFGTLFRLRIFFDSASREESVSQAAANAPAVQGYLELTSPGEVICQLLSQFCMNFWLINLQF